MMCNSRAHIKIVNPVFLDILLRYMNLGAFEASGFECIGITMREARMISNGGWIDKDDNGQEDETDNECCVVAVNNYTDEPSWDYGPSSVDTTAYCVFRLIEDEYKINDRHLFENCKSEVKANYALIRESYEVIIWQSECNDPYDGWSYSFSYDKADKNLAGGEGELINPQKELYDDYEYADDFGDTEFDDDWCDDISEETESNDSSYEWDTTTGYSEDRYCAEEECSEENVVSDIQRVVINKNEKIVNPKRFLRFEKLTDVFIEDGVERIGVSAFSGCKSLVEICVPGSVKSIGQRAFAPCLVTRTFQVPECEYKSSDCKVKWYGNERIVCKTVGQRVACENLRNVVLEEGVEVIGKSAFENCSALRNISVPLTVNCIGSYAFQNCTSLEHIVIPLGVTRIGAHTFDGCTNLRSIEIPASVKSIGDYAFFRCSRLSSVIIHGDLKEIGKFAFFEIGNEGGEEFNVVIEGECEVINDSAFENTRNIVSIQVRGKIKCVGKNAFRKSGVKELKDEGIKTIETSAFAESQLLYMPNMIGLESIGPEAFSNCNGLNEINVPGSVWELEGGVFSGCKELQKASLGDGIQQVSAEMFAGCTKLETILLPSTARFIDVGAFQNCTSLTEVDVPKRVRDIYGRAFYGCVNLRKLTVHSNIRPDDDDIFQGCMELKEINGHPKLTRRLTDTLNGITKKHRLTIKGTVKIVTGEYVAKQKPFISLIIGEGVEEIDDFAFSECKNLQSARIAGTVKRIRANAFQNCQALELIILEEGIEAIENWAFLDCVNLKQITIPGSVKTIGNTAFNGCPLEKVILSEGIKNVPDGMFEHVGWVEIPKSIEHIGILSIKMGSTIVVEDYTREIMNAAQRERLRVLLRKDGVDTEIADYRDLVDEEWDNINPMCLERAHELSVEQIDDTHYRVMGGSSPHVVTKLKFGLDCDCADFVTGNKNCKHIIRVRMIKEQSDN